MYPKLQETIIQIEKFANISDSRKAYILPLMDFIQQKTTAKQEVNLNFICTHNSRRSHLAQIWAQIAAYYYAIPNVYCYSGGTEETVLFPQIIETLRYQGLNIAKITTDEHPIYTIKYGANTMPIVGFSKKFDNAFNPESEFAAVMTCSQADSRCPFIPGAEKRISITFEDPKLSDGSSEQVQVYAERSLQIATEMFYIFSKIKK